MSSKWLGLALIVSLVINLLLAGFVIGRLSQGPMAVGPDPTMAFPRFAADLPEERRREVRPQIRSHLAALRPNRRALHSARQQINAAIVADPFEADVLETALADMHQAQTQLSKSAQKTFVQFIGSLSQAERVQFVQQNKRPRKRSYERPPRPE